MTICLDSACGDGSLLAAVQRSAEHIQCVGMDVDVSAIRRLRSRNPHWTLSRANALAESSWQRVRAGRDGIDADLALLNPPFSMGASKGIVVDVPGFAGRCSVAMAHVLTVLTRAEPRVCCAIVPESVVYSSMDDAARTWIASRYWVSQVRGLRNTTFRGARANAVVLQWSRRPTAPPTPTATSAIERRALSVTLVRGGLPVCEAKGSKRGKPYIHSTEIGVVAKGRSLNALRKVRAIQRGIVSGHVILLPRVGVPNVQKIRAVELRRRVQLSDCVIALSCQSRSQASKWQRMLRSRKRALCSLYRGTGARYVTIVRLRRWLASLRDSPNRSRQRQARVR